eukprot:CAMPEP_0202708448 /NCGR_PEP_ID=MMETSP1385-20130828/20656_1 /ASSEMBLY_ACC=CAM_ASM_000861 /TAXON_ID=933848 /ORGANISM="Elphidium margaritaceum" /LENGTH=1228 /DNA_ID=CAMNT_0049367423 /DNA_START=306 /DNA_END=3992 /DNA_ORIENTATION=-
MPSKRQSDFVRFTIHLGDMSLSDEQLIQLSEQKIIPLLDEFLAEKRRAVASKVVADTLQRVVIALYLNQNCLRGHGVLPILKYIQQRDFRLLTLQLFRNCVDDEGCAQLMSVVRHLKYPPNELHISHNKVRNAGFNAIVDMLSYRHQHRHELLSYPARYYQTPTQHTIQSRVPLWLRVENNQIDVEAATQYMQRQRITHCLANNLSRTHKNKQLHADTESMAFYCHSQACVPDKVAAVYARDAAAQSVGACAQCEKMRRQQQQKQKRNHSRKVVVCKNCLKKAKLIEQYNNEQPKHNQKPDFDVEQLVQEIDNNAALSVDGKIAAMERLSMQVEARALEQEQHKEDECRHARTLEQETWQAAICEVPANFEIPMVHLHRFEDQLKQAVTNSKVLMAIGDSTSSPGGDDDDDSDEGDDDDDDDEEEKEEDDDEKENDAEDDDADDDDDGCSEQADDVEDVVIMNGACDATHSDDDKSQELSKGDCKGNSSARDGKGSTDEDGKAATEKVSAVLPIIMKQQATDIHFRSEQGHMRQQYEESLLRNSETPLFIMCDTCSILRMVALQKKSAMNYWETMLTQKQKMEYVLRLSKRCAVKSEKRQLNTSGAYQRWLRMEVLPRLKVHLVTDEVQQLADTLCRTSFSQKRQSASHFESYTPRHLDIIKCQIYRFVALYPHKIPASDKDRHAWQQVIQKHIFNEIGYQCPSDLVSTFITETRKLVKQYQHQKAIENAKLFTLNTLIDKAQHGEFGFGGTRKCEQSCLLIPHTVTQELEHIKVTGARGNKSKGDLWRVQQLCGSGGLLEVLCKQSGCDILGSEHGEAHLTFRHGNNDYTIISVAEYYSKLLNNDRNLGFVLLTNDKAMYTIASGKGIPVVSLNTLNEHLQTQSAEHEWKASYLRDSFIKSGFVGGFARKHLVEDAVHTLKARQAKEASDEHKSTRQVEEQPKEKEEKGAQTDTVVGTQVDADTAQQMVREILFRRQQICAYMRMEQAHITQLDTATKLTAALLSVHALTQQASSSKPDAGTDADADADADASDSMQKLTVMVQQAQFVWSQLIDEFQQRNSNVTPKEVKTTATESEPPTLPTVPESHENSSTDESDDASSVEPAPLNAEEQARLLAIQESLAASKAQSQNVSPPSSSPLLYYNKSVAWSSSELLGTFDCDTRANLEPTCELLLSQHHSSSSSSNASQITPFDAEVEGTLIAGWELFKQQCESGVNGQYVEEEIQMS